MVSVLAHHGTDCSEQAISILRIISKFAQDVIAAGILGDPQQLTASGQACHLPTSETLTEATAVLANQILGVLEEVRKGEWPQNFGIWSNVTSHSHDLVAFSYSLHEIEDALRVEPGIRVYSNSIIHGQDGGLLKKVRQFSEQFR